MTSKEFHPPCSDHTGTLEGFPGEVTSYMDFRGIPVILMNPANENGQEGNNCGKNQYIRGIIHISLKGDLNTDWNKQKKNKYNKE